MSDHGHEDHAPAPYEGPIVHPLVLSAAPPVDIRPERDWRSLLWATTAGVVGLVAYGGGWTVLGDGDFGSLLDHWSELGVAFGLPFGLAFALRESLVRRFSGDQVADIVQHHTDHLVGEMSEQVEPMIQGHVAARVATIIEPLREEMVRRIDQSAMELGHQVEARDRAMVPLLQEVMEHLKRPFRTQVVAPQVEAPADVHALGASEEALAAGAEEPAPEPVYDAPEPAPFSEAPVAEPEVHAPEPEAHAAEEPAADLGHGDDAHASAAHHAEPETHAPHAEHEPVVDPDDAVAVETDTHLPSAVHGDHPAVDEFAPQPLPAAEPAHADVHEAPAAHDDHPAGDTVHGHHDSEHQHH